MTVIARQRPNPAMQLPLEIHLTVAVSPNQEAALQRIAAEHACKPLWIELPGGVHHSQPMLSWRQTDSLAKAQERARMISDSLEAAGLPVIRTKIEADLASISNEPACYFECHFKIELNKTDMPRLSHFASAHGAHLSRNAWASKTGSEQRFLTLRHNSLAGAVEKFAKLGSALSGAGWKTVAAHAEAILYDDRLELDQGWLP